MPNDAVRGWRVYGNDGLVSNKAYLFRQFQHPKFKASPLHYLVKSSFNHSMPFSNNANTGILAK